MVSELTGMDIGKWKLLAKVTFSIVCWYLILCCFPKLFLVIAGIVGASGFCLLKVMECCCRIAGEIMTILEHRRTEINDDVAFKDRMVALSLSDIGPRVLTAKQRRLGVQS